jgi:hypothetical protein
MATASNQTAATIASSMSQESPKRKQDKEIDIDKNKNSKQHKAG